MTENALPPASLPAPASPVPVMASAVKAPPAAFPADLVVGDTAEFLAGPRAHLARVRDAVLDGRPAEFTLGGGRYETDVVPLGTLRVPHGVVGAVDPFIGLDHPVRIPVPPGTYPVFVTTVTHLEGPDAGDTENAHLTVRIADGERALVRAIGGPEGKGVHLDSATAGFVDADAVLPCMPKDRATWKISPYAFTEGYGWHDLIDDPDTLDPLRDNTVRRVGMLNVTMPRATADENVVMVITDGPGWFPCLVSGDAEGNVLDITIDLGVIDIWD